VPNPGLTPRPQDIVAYACLFKDLRFPVAFERMDDSLTFRGVPVRAFGMANYKPAHETMYPQVQILDYRTEDDFIIELKTKSDGDRLILAKIQPSSTILDTITNIHQRIGQGKHEPAVRADEMIVPRINFDILREYSELQGRRLITTQPDVARDLRLVSAVQDTDFELNEQGVRLKSESHMAFACAKAETPVPTHKMIFDKPFLLLLQRANATQPYFVIWIDNAELLVR
jgi:hypothetical protein